MRIMTQYDEGSGGGDEGGGVEIIINLLLKGY